jgi:hypothetical protein
MSGYDPFVGHKVCHKGLLGPVDSGGGTGGHQLFPGST